MSPIIKDPKDVRARYAGRLARQQYYVRQAYRANPVPELATVVANLARQRIEHRDSTGWYAAYDGDNAIYYYTTPTKDPTKRAEDLRKALWYTQREIERIERNQP